MLADISKIVLGFLLTGVVGALISAKVQRQNFANQTKISKAEKELEKTKEIIKKIESLSSIRAYTAKVVIDNLVAGSPDPDTDNAREEYRKAVSEWNINITSIFIELKSLDLYNFALELDHEIQPIFKKSHDLIRNKITKNSSVNSKEISSMLNTVYKLTRSISSRILEDANKKWQKTIDGNASNLNECNINKATIWTLIKALFHKNPRSLRVFSSSND